MDKDYFMIHRMKQGDESAIDDFVKLYYPHILKYCYYKLSDKWLAEDITQETFINFFKHFTTYIHKGKVKNYLYITAGNLCKNQYKKRIDVSTDNIEVSEITMPAIEIGIINKIVLKDEIIKLPLEFQEVIVMYYYHYLKISEIACILNIKSSLVKYRLSESKKLLKKNMQREDFYE